MKRFALLCLLIAGCGTVHASSIKPARTKGKRPAAVKKVSTAAGDLSPASPQKEVAPAAASDPIGEAVKREKEKRASAFDQHVISVISGDDPPPPPPPPGPQPDPNPAPLPGDEPFLSLPASIEGEVGDFIEISAKTNCKRVTYMTLDKGLKKFPDSVLADPVSTVVSGLNNGSFRLIAFAAKADVVVTAETVVMLHGAQPPPLPPVPPAPPVPPLPPVPQPPVPPVPPPAPVNPTAAKLFIITIDNVSSRDGRTAAVLTDMKLWGDKTKPPGTPNNGFISMGHEWLKLNSTEADATKFKQMVDANGGYPVVVIMDATNYVPGRNQNLKWLNQGINPANGRPWTSFPATSAGMQALIDKYTAR